MGGVGVGPYGIWIWLGGEGGEGGVSGGGGAY